MRESFVGLAGSIPAIHPSVMLYFLLLNVPLLTIVHLYCGFGLIHYKPNNFGASPFMLFLT